jgi:hypothetical protein
MQGGLIALVWQHDSKVDVYLGTVNTSHKDLVESAKKDSERINLCIAFFDSIAMLRILEDIRFPKHITNQRKFLIEAPVMYEAIRPFLQALQVVPESIPFERYLPHQAPGKLAMITVQPPKFSLVPGFEYQLASLFPHEAQVGSLKLDVKDPDSIAAARRLLVEKSRLDFSQAHAMIDTLTRELALIQGPPGTGKVHSFFVPVKLLRY